MNFAPDIADFDKNPYKLQHIMAHQTFPNSNPADALSPTLSSCLETAQNALLAQQNAEGYWWYTLEANDTINAEYLFLMHFMGIQDEPLSKGICKWIERNQRDDGSWALYFEGPGCLSTTVECYIALKMNGVSPDSPVLTKAREFILKEGGITKVRVFTRIHLALLDLIPWSACPKMPVEFIQIPEWAPVNIYEFSSWARASIVPLLVIMDVKKSYPAGIRIDELYTEGEGKVWKPITAGKKISFENAFIQIDKSLHVAEKVGSKVKPLRPLRGASLKKCEKYIREHLRETEDIYPALAYGALALWSLGAGLGDPDLKKALNALKSFQITNVPKPDLPDSLHEISPLGSSNLGRNDNLGTVYQQCCVSPIWDTAWAGVALLEAGTPGSKEEITKAARLLLKHQVTDRKGDWAVKNPYTEPGGWSFEFENTYYPDTDDTIEVLTYLYKSDLPYRELKPAFDRGVNWLLSMQSSNGGFGAFDKDNDLELLNKIPFSDHGACLDPATADITGRVIEFLMNCTDTRTNSPVLQRAADFIVSQQAKDGSFWGRWGVNHIYGTWGALGGLCALNRNKDKLAINRAIKWLKSIQNEDGGFGESCASYLEEKYVPLGVSTASQTAWALMSFVAAGLADSPEAHKAANFLISTQNNFGLWDEQHFTGTGFPGHFYIRYHGYRAYFPLLALSKYKQSF